MVYRLCPLMMHLCRPTRRCVGQLEGDHLILLPTSPASTRAAFAVIYARSLSRPLRGRGRCDDERLDMTDMSCATDHATVLRLPPDRPRGQGCHLRAREAKRTCIEMIPPWSQGARGCGSGRLGLARGCDVDNTKPPKIRPPCKTLYINTWALFNRKTEPTGVSNTPMLPYNRPTRPVGQSPGEYGAQEWPETGQNSLELRPPVAR